MKTKLFLLVLMTAQLHLFAKTNSVEDFVVHEWGTFTSVQGAEGVQLEWNPFITAELPKFVYDRNRTTARSRVQRLPFNPAKGAFATLQRMETPVIYFYSDRERTVDVRVDFPKGLITEWYPQVKQFGPMTGTNRAEAALSRQSFLRWDAVQLLPEPWNPLFGQALPLDQSGSHYYAARETDADLLQVRSSHADSQKQEQEKFLFYRGVGHFTAPLTVTLSGDENYALRLQNTGPAALAHLFVLNVRDGQGKFVLVKRLATGESKTIKFDPNSNQHPLSDVVEQISRQMQSALISEGLYEREAAAMVKTWRESWFEEQGLRVLYILPREWTDGILPLKVSPQPREIVRVMVGRAEVLTPPMEWELLKQIVRYSDGDDRSRRQTIENVRKLGLGRFAEPVARRLIGKIPSRQFSQLSWELLEAATKPETEPKGLARR